jgi:hypothetical protein
MRIADRLGRPLSWVLSEIPEWELPYWSSWLSREPDSGRRVEFAVCRLLSTFISANNKKGHKAPEAHDLVLPDWYAQQNKKHAVKHDIDRMIAAFSKAGAEIKYNRRGNV